MLAVGLQLQQLRQHDGCAGHGQVAGRRSVLHELLQVEVHGATGAWGKAGGHEGEEIAGRRVRQDNCL